MSPARERMGWAAAAVIILLGLTYPVFGSQLVQALTPDAEGCAGFGDLPTEPNAAQTRRATLCLLNVRRTEAGVRALTSSPILARAARTHEPPRPVSGRVAVYTTNFGGRLPSRSAR